MATQNVNKEPRYNLSFVTQETGIKADTLRAWERRYQLPQPQRTDGGHRLFSEYDIQTIKWLMARQKEGLSISRAVRLWREIESQGENPLSAYVSEQMPQAAINIPSSGSESLADLRNAWLQACLNFDETAAEQVLNQAFAQFPMETVCVEILQSGLSTIGTLWHQGDVSVQQEHFASELANRRLHALIAAAPQPVRERTILIVCAPGENHTFSALLTTVLLRYRSWPVVYLGANVPQGQLLETIEHTKPGLVVLTAMRLPTSATLYDTAVFLRENDVPVGFGGWIFTQIPELPKKIPGHYLGGDVLEGITSIEKILTELMPQIEVEFGQDDFAETIASFRSNKHHIEMQTLDSMVEKMGRGLPLENIQDANEYLAQDLIAALSLGNLTLIENDLVWIESLIAHRDDSSELLFNYLLAYYEAVQSHLDESGDPIIDWLASIIRSKA